jgi:hypothetical protein
MSPEITSPLRSNKMSNSGKQQEKSKSAVHHSSSSKDQLGTAEMLVN